MLAAEGDYREGVLSPAGDRDWYRITLAEGQGVRIALTVATARARSAIRYLILHGPDGAELARDDDGGDGLNSRGSNIKRRRQARTTSKCAASLKTPRAATPSR